MMGRFDPWTQEELTDIWQQLLLGGSSFIHNIVVNDDTTQTMSVNTSQVASYDDLDSENLPIDINYTRIRMDRDGNWGEWTRTS